MRILYTQRELAKIFYQNVDFSLIDGFTKVTDKDAVYTKDSP
jgi:hypothetical protein